MSKTNLPWITNSIRKMIRKRNAAYQKQKHSKEHADILVYKHLKRNVQTQIRKSYWENVESILSGDEASTYQTQNDANVMAIVVALGITFVTITGPFWAMVTDPSIHYLNLHNYIQPLHTKVQFWLDHPHDILTEDNNIFPDFPPRKDHPMLTNQKIRIDQHFSCISFIIHCTCVVHYYICSSFFK